LGDPIEVGAALAVLATKGGRSKPLDLIASKSWVGHGEPAAGLAGILVAHQAATAHMALPIMHLRNTNPYVGDALCRTAVAVRFPRQQAVLASDRAPVNLMGVSAFAFQGTNAHIVLRDTNDSEEGSKRDAAMVSLLWQHRRAYVLPPINVFAQRAGVFKRGSTRLITFQANLAVPQLAYVWHHRVLQRCIFPGW